MTWSLCVYSLHLLLHIIKIAAWIAIIRYILKKSNSICAWRKTIWLQSNYMLDASKHVGLFLLNADIFTTPLLISIFCVSYGFVSSKHVCLPAVCLFLYFLALLCLQSFPAEQILILCASAWGALFVVMRIQVRRRRTCACPTWHSAYDPWGPLRVCASVCVRKCVCGRLHHSSCLLTSIHTPMTELHSKPIQAATFRTPPKQTLISNNASWDCSQNYAVKSGDLEISRATMAGQTECWYRYGKGMQSTSTI